MARSASLLAAAIAAAALAAGAPGPEAPWEPGVADGLPVIRSLTVQGSSSGAEGAVVSFAVSASDPDGAPLTIEWDPGDGSPPRSGVALTTLTHRYVDEVPGGEATVRVTVRSTSGEAVSRTLVHPVVNVAPSIVSMTRDGVALPGSPITFQTVVADPGVTDEIRYAWDFGDGGTGEGSTVVHTFDDPGTYLVRLSVDDGDGGRDERTMTVIVGSGGAFSVAGDIDIPSTDVTFMNVAGVGIGNGLCQLRIQLTIDGEAGMGIQSVLRQGLAPGRYRIGAATTDAGIWTQNQASPGLVTATFGADRKYDSDPQGRMRFGFWSTSGLLEVTSFDGSFLQASFEIRFRERVVESWDPRQVVVRGAFSASTSGGGNVYMCEVGEQELVMVSTRPGSEDRNVDWEEPSVAMGFNRPLDPGSLADNVVLEMRGTGGFRAVAGTWVPMPGDDAVIRFEPTSALLEAVIYCIRVRSGPDGIRGREGEIYGDAREVLSSTTRAACSDADRWGGRHVTWAFSTVPTLAGVRPAVYQAHRGMPLIPGRSTLTRVFYDWQPPDPRLGIHEAAQVKRTPVAATVETGEGGYLPRSRMIVRSDLLSARDSIYALNSINVFGWRPSPGGPVSVEATLEPLNQTRQPPRRFSGTVAAPLEREDHGPDLDVDYYYLEVGSWDDGVPSWAVASGDRLMQDGADFITSNFPVTITRASPRGAVDIDEAWFEYDGRRLELSSDLFVASAVPIGWELLQKVGTSSADVVVGLVPADVLPDGTGVTLHFTPEGELLGSGSGDPDRRHFSFGTAAHRVLLIRLAEPGGGEIGTNARTVAHELGHYYYLCHTDDSPAVPHDCGATRHEHQGFRILPGGASGRNKDEGNPEVADGRTVVPLMRSGQATDAESFVSRQNYASLTSTLQVFAGLTGSPAPGPGENGALPFQGSDPVRLASRTPGMASRAGAGPPAFLAPRVLRQDAPRRMVVSGVMDAEGSVLALGPARIEEAVPAASPPPGVATPLRARLLGSRGEVLGEIPVPLRAGWSHHVVGGPSPDGVRFFRAELPFDDDARRWVLDAGGEERAALQRSASPPTVSIDAPPPPDPEGPFELRWTGTDPDGDPLRYSVHYAPDGQSWRVLSAHGLDSSLRIDPELLEPGPDPVLRVQASDGFDLAEARTAVTVPRRLRILITRPAPDEPSPPDPAIYVTFRGDPTFDVYDARALTLRDADGDEIPGATVVDDGGRRLVYVPVIPLRPGIEYTVTLRGGLTAVDGRRLDGPVTWTFRTGGG